MADPFTPAADPPNTRLPWTGFDSVVCIGLGLFAMVYTMLHVHWHEQPYEDALMLLRYANNLVHGYGIAWNPGERPVEGATDFLFLIMTAGLMKVSSLHAILASRLILLAAQTMDVALLYFGTRRLFGANRAVCAGLAIFLAVGPGVNHVDNGFSAALFAFFAMAAWYSALSAVTRGPDTRKAVAFAIAALLLGLTRPEGVLLAVFMAAAVGYALRERSTRMLLTAGSIFVVLGGTYFLWRFHYFGYLLPAPFYKKGGGHLYPDSLKASIRYVLTMLLPALPVIALALAEKRSRARAIFLLIPVVGFTCIWALLTDENNYVMRFQYVVVPITLLGLPYLFPGVKELFEAHGVRWRQSRAFAAAVLLLAGVGGFVFWRAVNPPVEITGYTLRDIGVQLHPYRDRGYTMAVTEAGALPYFSDWRTIDLWGLNDPAITRNPQGLTAAYLDQSKPAIIMLYSAVEDVTQLPSIWTGYGPPVPGIARYSPQAVHYAATHNYELVARWYSEPCEVYIWYVRRDIPDYAAIRNIIQASPYFMMQRGVPANNYLDSKPPTVCKAPPEHLSFKE